MRRLAWWIGALIFFLALVGILVLNQAGQAGAFIKIAALVIGAVICLVTPVKFLLEI